MKQRIILAISLCGALLCFGPGPARAGVFAVDPVYSNLLFKIKHLNAYTIGSFQEFKGFIDLNENNTEITGFKMLINVASVDTRNAARDNDLRSERFFDVASYQTATFVGKKISDTQIFGDLTLKGITKPVVLDYRLGGTAQDQYGRTKIGFSAKGFIDRQDFKVTWNQKLDRGQMLLGDQVELILELEGVLQN